MYTVNRNDISEFIQHDRNKTIEQRNVEVPDSFLLMIQELRGNASLVRSLPLTRQNQGNVSSSSSSSNNRRCVCQMGVCKCCTGYIMDLLNQKACMRVTYHPGDFAFDVAMSLNNRVLYENSLSGKCMFIYNQDYKKKLRDLELQYKTVFKVLNTKYLFI